MKTLWGRRTGLALSALLLPFALSAMAFGADLRDGQALREGQKMWLACENGQNYPIQPVAVSREDDLVTGYLLRMGTRHSVHLRLVPMGSGYRYEGGGMWFDGLRQNAVLNWGRPGAEVPCTVIQE
jgi:hypothetical protein